MYQKYLVEEKSGTERPILQARKIADDMMKKLYKESKKYKFTWPTSIDLIHDLTKIAPKNISFRAKATGGLSSLVLSAIYHGCDNTIEISIAPKAYLYFQRFNKEQKKDDFLDVRRNLFYKELIEVLSHELSHRRQLRVSDRKVDWDTGDRKASEYIRRYYSNKHEVDAFASQAAAQIAHGGYSTIFSEIEAMHKEGYIDTKTFNRFMKKVDNKLRKLKASGYIK